MPIPGTPSPSATPNPPPAPKKSSLDNRLGQFKPSVEGEMSTKQLKWSYWYVTHHDFLRRLLIILLLVISVGTLGFGLYGITEYLFFGLPRELQYEKELRLLPNTASSQEAHKPLDLSIDSPEVFDADTDIYDIVTPIENLNTEWYARFTFRYTFEGGATTPKEIIISPGQKFVLAEIGLKSPTRPSDAVLDVSGLEWSRISRHTAPDPSAYVSERTNFLVEDAKYIPGAETELVASNQALFSITNATPYSYWNVDVAVLLKSGDRTVGVLTTVLDRLMSNERRTIDLRTPKKFGTVTALEILSDAHIFDPANFLAPGQ
ncbi:MAG: hypothetical protein HW383_652 [Candidatus Magasanikbacteria bacterium]|nr:hypothetical protein [Candidatus Magasanikbacteria bacterium]